MTQSPISDPESQTEQTPPTAEQCRQLTLAVRRTKKIATAEKIAAFNGWTLAIFSFFSFTFFLLVLPSGFSMVAFLVSLGLAVTAFNEFRGRRMLRQFNLAASRLLGANQILLIAIIIAYCTSCVYAAWKTPEEGSGPYAEYIEQVPELAPMLNDPALQSTVKYIVTIVYSIVALCSVLFQGINSLYYFSIRKHLLNYIKQTPPWAVELLRDLQR